MKLTRTIVEELKVHIGYGQHSSVGGPLDSDLISDWLEMEAALREKPSSEAYGMATAHAMLTELVKKFEANDPPMYLPKEWTAQQIKLVLSAIGTQPQKPKPAEPGKIIAYEIFPAFEEDDPAVNEALRDGWELFGPPFCGDKIPVLQAMVRREPAK